MVTFVALFILALIICMFTGVIGHKRSLYSLQRPTTIYKNICKAFADCKWAIYHTYFAPEKYLEHFAYQKAAPPNDDPFATYPCQPCLHPDTNCNKIMMLPCGHLICKSMMGRVETDQSFISTSFKHPSFLARYFHRIFNVHCCAWDFCRKRYTPNLKWTYNESRGNELRKMLINGYSRNISQNTNLFIPNDINSTIDKYYNARLS